MFKKMLASVGIGNAAVDTRLHNDTILPGQVVEGEIVVRGGDIPQEVTRLNLYLATQYKREVNDSTVTQSHVLAEYAVVQGFTAQPGETTSYPFSIQIPYQTPLSMGRRPIVLRTGLDIPNAVDAGDTDHIQVAPHPLQQGVLRALEQLGFRLYSAENEYNRKWRGPYPFVQEFEFKPGGNYRRQLEELELIFSLHEHGLDVFLELDKRSRGLAKLFEDFDLNERYAHLQLSNADAQRPDLATLIDNVIQQRIG